MADFTHVETWIFDLDNTLYPSDCRLFDQIDRRMTDFVVRVTGHDRERARRLQKEYYAAYGTTLNGLMRNHDVAPEAFLDYVHDIDLAPVAENPDLAAYVAGLPGRRYVFTNGSVAHAQNVMGKLGIDHLFDDIFDIVAADYVPKPHAQTYGKFLERHEIAPAASAMFEDMPQNLEAPYALGMTTVLIRSKALWIDDEPENMRPAGPGETHDHVHYAVDDLTDFLSGVRHSGHKA